MIALEPAPFFEAVNVTSSRTDVPRADPTVTVTVIPASELLSSAAVSIDDALKMVPGFTLFRRTSSRVSNPTAQGISLRGLGGTGASRSLVLANGIPLNDAFGGWVYWDKVPQAAIDRIEVQRGSGTDLYGADAVGGVVQILTVRPGRPTARAVLEGGNMETRPRLALRRQPLARMGLQRRRASGSRPAATFPWPRSRMPGIAPRGPIDSRARVRASVRDRHRSATRRAMDGALDATGSVFDEDRLNGTPADHQLDGVTAACRSTWRAAWAAGCCSLRGFGGTQGYDCRRSRRSTRPAPLKR